LYNERWGIPASIDDRVWMMERGMIKKDEELLTKYYSAKAYAKQMFIESMKGVDGFQAP